MYAVCVANSAAQVSTRLYTGRMPSAWRRARTSASVVFEQVREAPVGEALALRARAARRATSSASVRCSSAQLDVDDLLDLRQEPRDRSSCAVNLLERHADAERVGDVPQPLGARIRELVADRLRIDGLQVEAVDAGLEPAQRLLQRLLERAADRHHFADRLHLRGEPVVGLLEFLEGEARHLGDDVVDRRLERRRRVAPPVMSFFSSSSV